VGSIPTMQSFVMTVRDKIATGLSSVEDRK
jgi:hypothetical protein